MTKLLDRIRVYETVEECYDQLSLELIQDPNAISGYRGTFNFRMYSHDWTIVITNPTSTLNLSMVDFQANRWAKRFLPEYFEAQSFSKYLAFLKTRKGNEAQEYGYKCSTKARHSLGNCLLGVTVRPGKKDPRVALFSRSCYLQPTGLLDLSLGAVLADYVTQLTGVQAELVWHVSHLQTNCWKFLPYMLNRGIDPDEIIPGNEIQARWLSKLQDALQWAREDFDPNPRYQFYRRQLKKIHKIWAREEAGEPLSQLIPALPQAYLQGVVDSEDEAYEQFVSWVDQSEEVMDDEEAWDVWREDHDRD